MYRRGTNLEYRVFGPKETVIDACSFLNGTWKNMLVEILKKTLNRVSRETNIFHPCPLSVSFVAITIANEKRLPKNNNKMNHFQGSFICTRFCCR